jgi:hypothetical protein
VLADSSYANNLTSAPQCFMHGGQPYSGPHLAAYRRFLLEITVYLAMHPHRVYDVGVMFILLAWFITRPCAWAQLLLSTWLSSLSAATYFFHLALQFCLYDGRERPPRASAGHGRRFDLHSALCTQGASSALGDLGAWTIWHIISFSLTFPLTFLVVAY